MTAFVFMEPVRIVFQFNQKRSVSYIIVMSQVQLILLQMDLGCIQFKF